MRKNIETGRGMTITFRDTQTEFLNFLIFIISLIFTLSNILPKLTCYQSYES